MRYEWDNSKRFLNLNKHGIDFVDAIAVLEDERALVTEDDCHDEQRFIVVGKNQFGQLLVVVYTHREDDAIRIISARPANRIEVRFYRGDV